MATGVPSPEIRRGDDGGSIGTTTRSIQRMCFSIDVWLQNASYRIMNHIFWKFLIVIFTIILLFGHPCHFWFLPASSDPVMYTLFLVGFVIFGIDMIFHCYLDPLYSPFVSCKRNRERYCFPWVHVGSFNFWCDFLSTICFLLDVSYIFKSRFGRTTITIKVNDLGFPVRCFVADEPLATYGRSELYARDFSFEIQ